MEGLTASHSEQQQNMDLQLEGVKQQVKSLEDAHALDMKHTGEKLEVTDAALGALGPDVQKLSDAHEARCWSMEEELQDLREKTHQHLEQFWDTLHLQMEDLRQELMAEIAKLPSPPISTCDNLPSPGEPASVPSLDVEVGSTAAAAAQTRTAATVTGTLADPAAPTMPGYGDPTAPQVNLTSSTTGLTLLQAAASAAEGGGAVAKPVQRAPHYDGHADCSWGANRSQFQMLTSGLRWRRQLTWQSV